MGLKPNSSVTCFISFNKASCFFLETSFRLTARIKMFFGVDNGKWENIVSAERNRIAQNIQIILTGSRKTPNVAIYDNGEGQTPANFETTFLSIARGNKNDVPFVQGKYNDSKVRFWNRTAWLPILCITLWSRRSLLNL